LESCPGLAMDIGVVSHNDDVVEEDWAAARTEEDSPS
jgi:hypothetical protein